MKNEIKNICLKAAAFIEGEKEKEKNIELKELNSLVSYVDRTAEEMLINELNRLLPEAGFLVEEGTRPILRESTLEWIVDPLDGTTNYLHRLPAYALSIGLREGRDIILGAVYNIPQKRFYYAEKGKGATMNEERILADSKRSLSQVLIATGFPYTDFSTMAQYMAVFEQFLPRCRGVRRLGSAAIDLAMTAEGVFGGFFEWGLHPWDIAGGAVIAGEAGCLITDFKGKKEWLHGSQILVAPERIHGEMLSLFEVWDKTEPSIF